MQIILFFLAPMALVYLFVMAIKLNRILLGLLPVLIFVLLVIYQGDLIMQMGRAFVRYSLVWVAAALLVSLFLTRRFSKGARVILCGLCCLAAGAISFMAAQSRAAKPITPLSAYSDFVDVTAYRSRGDGIILGDSHLTELKEQFNAMTVRQDIMEESRNMLLDSEHAWYCLDLEYPNEDKARVVVFSRNEEVSLLRVETAEAVEYYKAMDPSDDLGRDWLNHAFTQSIRSTVKEQYAAALQALKQSFTASGTAFSFVIPEGMPEFYEIKIVGRPENGPSVSFLKEYNEAASWQAGQSYSFDVAGYAPFRYLYLAVSVYHEDFDLVNIFDMLPAELKSEEPQDYFNDAGI